MLVLPDVNEAQYLIEMWHHAGTVSQNANGISPLSWLEIRAWRMENEIRIDNFEINTIRRLSQEYVGEYYAATDKNRVAPYEVQEEEIDRKAIANKVKNVLAGFKQSNNESKYTTEDRKD